MSYPSHLQILIVEDEPSVKAAYELLMAGLGKTHTLLEPKYAFSYDDASHYLRKEKIFHLIVLDLRLPKTDGLPEGRVDYGLKIMSEAMQREDYPVPALIVVSGQIDSADQLQLQRDLALGFFYGKPVVKSLENRQEIEDAISACKRYIGVGIHLKDSPSRQRPGLSPREEDLLRRFVLEEGSRVGLDLAWWTTEKKGSNQGAPLWAKVLMGRVLLDTGDESRPMFFKLVQTSLGAEHDISSAKRLADKLSHVNVKFAITSPSVSLIVTEKVGGADTAPVPLLSFLDSEECDQRHCARIAQQITHQCKALGETGPDHWPLSRLLWKNHELERIDRVMSEFGPDDEESVRRLRDVYDHLAMLMNDETSIRILKQSFLHGDLHVGNIALDIADGDVGAFIFDAGATSPHSCVRDVASLEVALVLHQGEPPGVPLVAELAALYGTRFLPEGQAPGTRRAANTFDLVAALRASVQAWEQPWIYALQVLDAALVQLGSLDFGISQNKITDPSEAVALVLAVYDWYRLLRAAQAEA